MSDLSRAKFVISLYVAMFLVLLLSFFAIPRTLLWGWIVFIFNTVPHIKPDWPTVLLSVIATILFGAGVHWLGKRVVRYWSKNNPDKTSLPRWTIRSSISFVSVLFLLFIAGISMVGAVHQTLWLSTSKEPKYRGRPVTYAGGLSKNTLKYIGLALSIYHDTYSSFPPGGTYDENGNGMKNWTTGSLIYLNYALPEDYDENLPWDHPANVTSYQCVLSDLINPELTDTPIKDSNGFGLSHYAANSRALGANSSIKLSEISGGAANLLLVGEINTDFLPWGHPFNMRDPTNGINKSRRGFGGPPKRKGALFVKADGSVTAISENIDPAVLRALSSPGGH